MSLRVTGRMRAGKAFDSAIAWGEWRGKRAADIIIAHATRRGPHDAFVAMPRVVLRRLCSWLKRRAKSNSRLAAACHRFAEVHGPCARFDRGA
jgi:hypothetical protein